MITHYRHTPIFYETQGSGPALVLLHGFLESSTMWLALADEFKAKYTVITLDLPGFGKSGCFNEIHTMEAMADVVIHVLDTLHIPSAICIGHSMGGYVGLALIDLYESRIEKLVLLNSTTVADDAALKLKRNRAVEVLERHKESYVRMSITNLHTESARINFASEIMKQKLEAIHFPKEGLQAAHLGMRDRPDRTSVLANFNKEKYIVAGVDDTIAPLDSLEHIAQITKTSLYKVEGGHMLLTENWEKTVKVLRLIV